MPYPHPKLLICISIIANPNNKQMTVFNVGISPTIAHAINPNTIVPIPNPANLIFQNAPKCSYDHLVLQKNSGAINKLVKYNQDNDFKNGLSGHTTHACSWKNAIIPPMI
tara:strand:+ start:257 stop:586 length:330 start_codon:yes stop_codon:yes gene_type:complete